MESDCLGLSTLSKAVTNGIVLAYIIFSADFFDEIVFKFIPRTCINVALHLAKLAMENDISDAWTESVPPKVEDAVLMNCTGLSL